MDDPGHCHGNLQGANNLNDSEYVTMVTEVNAEVTQIENKSLSIR